MFSYDNNNKYISFYILNENNEKIESSSWEHLEEKYLSELFIIRELVENGFGNYELDCCNIDINSILSLNQYDLQILGLPTTYPFVIFIQSEGIINDSNFRFKINYFDFLPHGNNFNAIRNGSFLELNNGTKYLLSHNQFCIAEIISEYNQVLANEKDVINNYKCFDEIKKLSQNGEIIFDTFLQSTNVLFPDKIHLNIEEDANGKYTLIPQIGENKKNEKEVDILIPQKGFEKTFNTFPNPKSIYSTTDNQGERLTVIFDESIEYKNKKSEIELKIKNGEVVSDDEKNHLEDLSIQKILSETKKRKKVTKKEISDTVANIHKDFNHIYVELSELYSDRVIGYGLYEPKFYPFVCPYKSEWIPGLTIDKGFEGTKDIYLKTESEIALFEHEININKEVGNENIEWEGVEIPIPEAEFFLEIAKKQLNNPKSQLNDVDVKPQRNALIIVDNIESQDYESNSILKNNELNFEPINNLTTDIKLKKHQKQGVAWLQKLSRSNYSGCLLADDMGLGKTLQILYFLEWHTQNFNPNNKPYLIVAPVSLLENWENEYKRFFSHKNLEINLLYGSNVGKILNVDNVQNFQKKQILLTNYETLSAKNKQNQLIISAIDFAVIVLDEAQKIKTPGTFITDACKGLKSDFKIAMTGTPIENTYVDLWCIMDFAAAGLLGFAKDFAKEYQQPLKDENVDIIALGEKLRNKIGDFLLRRMKKDVLDDLPSKLIHNRPSFMPQIQQERYQQQIELALNSEVSGSERRNLILKTLFAIRDISDSPYLINFDFKDIISTELVETSAKLKETIKILYEIERKQEKAIIFTEKKATQQLVQKVLFDYFKLKCSIINGDTPNVKSDSKNSKLSRQQTIDNFHKVSGFNVIIMSQLAAGVGLNVTGANHVIHYSRHWNPAKEDQATDRAFRIGQLKDVHVYYPMAVFQNKEIKSFDETLSELLARKQNLASSTLYPTELSEVSSNEIFQNIISKKNDKLIYSPLSFNEITCLEPDLFEAFIAVLYSKLGYSVDLTPYFNDKGADVVILKDNDNHLIQVKRSRGQITVEAIQEIVTAKLPYENKYNLDFKLQVLTNASFTIPARTLAKENYVELIDGNKLKKLVSSLEITMEDIYKQENKRMGRI